MTPVTGAAALGPGHEFDAIRAMLERWGSLAVGIGDDAALITPPRGDLLVVSVDSAVEHRHFRREWLGAREIGYRAVTAALSDLAAMAALPLGVLLALAVPEDWRGDLLEIADGIGDAVRSAATVIRGGNVTGASEFSITTTVLGSAFSPLTRTGASPGDRVYVTGKLGGAKAALDRLLASGNAGPFRERFARPVARLTEARWLAAAGATAAIDISDGLVADLGHLAAASKVAVVVDADRLPCVDGVGPEDALASGEEYELVVTTATSFDVALFERRFGLALTEIGRTSADAQHKVTISGARVVGVTGHDHFS